ncbi:hypothetical protein STCU_00638 [Strigomonas culicis]|uniref:Uncharacterized protein n=1 Tax=Strigomonas culicis TaxID=28005 RepID=S9U2J5_9TRYP|nr:hypothetical protein STCU_07847 [Strigomonas culicis]EPY36333.1 hypothetical protein STCU_00638 [Strigomonas culicis]|eukprot:EPY23148.1 hypothetical protein STCU_07847 [Strigomonas culicis]
MHDSTAAPAGAPHTGGTPPPRAKLQRVETYVPLSSGGFLESEGQPPAGGDGDLPRPIAVGDIVCRRPKLFQLQGSAGAVQEKPPATATGAGTAALATGWVKGFKSEKSLSAAEQQYGKPIEVDMVGTLLEVTRVDRQHKQLEVTALSGKREKLRFADVRFAGYVEQGLYHRWKADPASRPVETLTAPAAPAHASPPSSSAPAEGTAQPAAADWWVLPRLVVRVMVEGSGRYGSKAVVLKVARKEEKMRLTPLELYGTAGATANPAHVFDVVGCANVDTVVPKKLEKGLMVKGEHRGELVTVRNRVRQQQDAGAEITQIEVQCVRTNDVWRVAPEEVCAILTAAPAASHP